VAHRAGGLGRSLAAAQAVVLRGQVETSLLRAAALVGDTDIGQIVGRTAGRKPPYTIERLRYERGSVAHFAVTVDAEIAAIATDVAPRRPLITSSLARTVMCNTRGMTPTARAARDIPDCQLCTRFIERLEDQIHGVRRVQAQRSAATRP
jgi:hypothetical protein